MREIKFRAWHGTETGMVKLPKVVYLGQTGIIDNFVGAGTAEWMQYTGLTDKNGVEIYEGDVVHKTYSNNLTATGEVIYDSGTYFVREVEGYAFLHGGHDGERIEVIGNIYENPELLEESK